MNKEKEQRAIEYLRMFEPEEQPYYLCYSGGKDNFGRDRLKALADEVNANIKEFYEDPEAGCYNIKRAIKQIGFDDNIGDIMDTLAVHDDLKAKLSRIKK